MTLNDVFEKYPPIPESEQNVFGIYAYVEKSNDKFYIKIGKAISQTIYNRNIKITCITPIVKNTIFIWEGKNLNDVTAHNLIKKLIPNAWAGHANEETGTSEAFEFKTLEELSRIKKCCDMAYGIEKAKEGKKLKIYQDIKDTVDEIIKNNCSQVEKLCTRWGKTNTVILLSKRYFDLKNIQFHILVSYVGTVDKSYEDTIEKDAYGEGYNSIAYIQANDKDVKEKLENAINNAQQIFYYLQLTGDDKVFTTRFNPIKDYVNTKNTVLYVEEADFGAHTENQIKKINNIPHKHIHLLSGTGDEKLNKLAKDFKINKWVCKDYVVDLLGTEYEDRKNDVAGVEWIKFNNSGLFKYDSELKPEQAENWSEMFNNFEKYNMYWKKFITSILEPEKIMSLNEDAQEFMSNLLQKNCVTEIFTSGNKSGHQALKDEIERHNNCKALVIDGDNTTNKDAEELTKNFIDLWKGNRIFIISTLMGTRSYSIKQIKNVILMLDCSSQDMVTQRVARGLTAWNGKSCRVIDMRLTQETDNLQKWIAPSCVTLKKQGRTFGEVIEWFEACKKLNFYEYFKAGIENAFSSPLVGRDFEKAMYSEDLRTLIAEDLNPDEIPFDLEVVPSLEINSKLLNENIKGEKQTAQREKNSENASYTEDDEDEDENISSKRQHAIFLLNGKRFFYDDFSYNTDIVRNTIKGYIKNERIYNEFLSLLKIDLNFLICIIDKYEKEYKRSFDDIIGDSQAVKIKNVDSQIATKLWCNQEAIFDLVFSKIHFNEGETVGVAFWANYYFINKLRKLYPKTKFIQIEEQLMDADYITGKLTRDDKTLKNFINILKMIKFDKIIMNPPYDKNLHLKILREAMKHVEKEGGEIVNLSPINSWQNEVIKEVPFSIGVTSIDFISRKEMNELFNISLRNDGGIVCINSNKTNDFTKFGHIVPYLSLRRKFTKMKDINYTHFIEKEPKNFSLRMFVGCNRDEGHSWTVCPKDELTAFSTEKVGHIGYLNFDTETERRNCYEIMSSPFIKAICKISAGLFTPFLPTYKKQWTDADLYEYFKLNKEEIATIEEEMK